MIDIISSISMMIWGINIGMLIIAVGMEIRRYKLSKHGVLHTRRGTYVTTNSDGGYTFTPKPKGSKRV